jgi:thioredoxin 1
MKSIINFMFFVTLIYCTNFTSRAFDKLPNDVKASKASGVTIFKGTFKEALAKAKMEHKMVVIKSYTTWCGPCKQMDAYILPDERLGKYFNEHFITTSVDMEKGEGPKLKRKYPHHSFPNLLFIKNNGKMKDKFLGLPEKGPEELLQFAKRLAN